MPKPGSRTIARLIVFVILLAGLALAIFLATLDLNRYRDEISSTLSGVFNRPVNFSQISFSMAHGLAVDCQNLDIKPGEDDPSYLAADHLYLKVSILPLITGNLVLRELILERPQLFLDLTAETRPKGLQPPGRESTLVNQLGEIHLHQGSVDLQFLDAGGNTTRISFAELDLMLQEQDNNRLAVELATRLQLEKKTAHLSIEGDLSGPDWPEWEENRVELELSGRGLPLRQIQKLFGLADFDVQLTGSSDLALKIDGTARYGLQFSSELKGPTARYRYQKGQPLPIGRWLLQGEWHHPSTGTHQLNHLTLGHKDLHLSSTLSLQDQTVNGELSLLQAPLASLLRLVPHSFYPEEFKDRLPQGQFSLTAAIPEIHLDQLNWSTLSRQVSATAGLQEFSWQPREMPLIEKADGRIELAAGQLNVTHLQASWQGKPQTLSGSIDLTGDQPDFNLQARLDPPLVETGQRLAKQTGQPIELSGRAPIELALKGPQTNQSVALQADLNEMAGSFGSWYEKPADLPGTFTLQLTRKGDSWSLAESYLQIDEQRLDLEGSGKDDGSFDLNLKSPEIDLQKTARRSRHLTRHNLRGGLGLDLTLSREQQQRPLLNGRLSLNNVGVHLTSLLADLNRANGTILFHGRGMNTVLINAHLGESPVTLQAALDDFSEPALKLRLQGKSVRTDELVFKNPRNHLNNLDGRLTIDGSGIGFDRIEVDLDGGTNCIVSGAMNGWHHPSVNLAVDAVFGNIDEVIALWSHPQPTEQNTPPETAHADQPGTTVIVDVTADQGRIGRLNFERATGTVISNGRGLLSVFPLQFHAAEGYGTGQVVADSTNKRATILKVSGHLENFPASGIHKDLLQRDSLVTGTLRGDFYLEGLAGEGFTRTANGGISIEVEDGVLKKFRFLSKVFSLLNVSQLFTLQLPDMAEAGMPFDRTIGTFSLNQGLLRSEDLLVHSEAMDLSLVADYDLLTNRIDGILGVKPLKTVDKIITKIPIAGWLLTGEDKALVTAHFTIKGDADNPEVVAVPVTSLSSKVFGIFKRVLTLPGKVITDPDKVILPQSVDPKE